jgi:hypothetical protein
MSKMSKTTNGVTWFEIGTSDAGAAKRFYGDVFGWTFADDGTGYQEISTPAEAGIEGGLRQTQGQEPGYAIFYVQVADVAATVAAAEAAGGKVLVPVTVAPDGLTFAHLLDPTGNHIGVFTEPARSS